ncbi:MAG: carboxypeptidase-like regulatory domain-containing protein [Caldilineaceae bacterium]
MWPGTNLQTTTDSDGRFSFNGLSAGVDDESSTYAIEVTYPNHLGPRTSINLRDYLVDENTHVIINFPDLWLLGGDVNNDNRINILIPSSLAAITAQPAPLRRHQRRRACQHSGSGYRRRQLRQRQQLHLGT